MTSTTMELIDDYVQLSVNLECENNEHGTIGSESIQWVDEARAALEQRIKELERDALRGRHLVENGCWHRSEDQTHLAVLVPHGSDLGCYAMRVIAVDRAMSEAALDKMREISQELGLP